jgi:RND family efflux transporter MFP subunit
LAIREPIAPETGAQRAKRPKRASRGSLLGLFVLLALVVGVAMVFGFRPRLAREKALSAASEAAEEKLPVVNVAPVRRPPSSSVLELPGDLQAYLESPIFARADGYMTKRLVDYGDRVHVGQLLAEIETPELDQQLAQARASVAQSHAALQQYQAALVRANANLRLAQVTLARWKRLAEKGVVSKQEGDEKQADFDVRQAEVAAAQANITAGIKADEASEAGLRRLEELKSFSKVTAPFDGFITSRNMDIGTLVNAGNGGPNREIFRIAQIQRMRIFVNVPQAYAPLIRTGQQAELRLQELPGQIFPATVARTTGSVDANSRTMLVILETPNPRGVLLPGVYAQVKFSFPGSKTALLVPGDALLLGREGPRVAVAGPDHIVHMRSIHIVHDYGADLEVDAGVADGDLVVVNPNDHVRENARVDPRGPSK